MFVVTTDTHFHFNSYSSIWLVLTASQNLPNLGMISVWVDVRQMNCPKLIKATFQYITAYRDP